jgi:hypothetical protein
MKRIPLLLCVVVLAAMPMATRAGGLAFGQAQGLNVGLGVGLLIGQQDDDRRHRHRGDDNNGDHRGDDRDNGGYGGYDRRDMGGGEDRRDNRINRAIAIAQSRGHVLDAGSEGGSVFWVRVNTPRGRVDLLIDADSGQIVGQR